MSEAYQPVLLRRVGKPNGTSLESYKADGGYNGLKNALAKSPKRLARSSSIRHCVVVVAQAFRPA